MTAPIPPSFDDGVISAAKLNQARDVQRFLMKPPTFKGSASATQNITTGTYTGMALDTDVIDTDVDNTGGHDVAVNNTRYAPVYSGVYSSSGGIPWASNATGRRGGRIAVNGTALDASGVLVPAAIASGLDIPFDRNLIPMTGGTDYAELQGFQDSGGTIATLAAGESRARFTMLWEGTG